MSGSSAVTTTCGKVADVDLRLLPQQQLKVTPKQIAANYILQLSSLELQDVINQELEENPALDLEEVQVCPLCGNPLTGRVCLNCFGAGKAGAAEQYSEAEPLEGTSLMARDKSEAKKKGFFALGAWGGSALLLVANWPITAAAAGAGAAYLTYKWFAYRAKRGMRF